MAQEPLDDWPYDDIPPPPPRLDQPRNRRNSFQSPRNQPERDAWAAARWSVNGWTYQQIADAMGLTSKSTAHDAVQRGLHAIREDTTATATQARAAHRSRLQYALEVATEIMEKDHLTISYGQVMKDGDVPIIDDGPKLAAAAKVKELSESLRKLDGLDAATRTETTVTSLPQDTELQERLRTARQRVEAEEQQLRGEA